MLFFLKPAQVAAVTYNKSGVVTAGSLLAGGDVAEHTETGAVLTGALLAGVRGSAESQKTGTVAAATWAAALGNQKNRTGAVAAGTNLAGADVYTATETGKVFAGTRFSGFFRPAPGPAGKFVITNAYVSVAGVDVSRFCEQVEVVMERDPIDVTPLDAEYRMFMDGPATGHFTISLFADPTINTAAFWALLDSPTTVDVRPRGQVITATNPSWTATVIAAKRIPLTGQVGEAAKASIELTAVSEILETL